MYIVAIAWIYVVLLMSLTETSVIAGIATFLVYGLAPLTLLIWLMGTPQRRRNRRKAQAQIEDQNRDGREVEDGMRTGSAEGGAVRAEEDGAEANPPNLEPR